MAKKLKTVTRRGDKLERLKALALILAEEIDGRTEGTQLAQLAKQYRETIDQIAELEGAVEEDDELGIILSERKADGKSGAVRKNRS